MRDHFQTFTIYLNYNWAIFFSFSYFFLFLFHFSSEIIFESNATTKSTVVLTLKPIDNGRPLTCLAISQPLERLLRKNGTIITSNGQWWSSMENILIRHILFEVKVHKKHYQHEQQQQNQEQQQQPGEKQQQRWQPNQIYKQPTELYRTSDSKINGQNERILFLGNQTDWLNGNDRNDQNGHYPLATSSYFVYDQIILNAQCKYFPRNITLNLALVDFFKSIFSQSIFGWFNLKFKIK